MRIGICWLFLEIEVFSLVILIWRWLFSLFMVLIWLGLILNMLFCSLCFLRVLGVLCKVCKGSFSLGFFVIVFLCVLDDCGDFIVDSIYGFDSVVEGLVCEVFFVCFI